MNTRCILKVLVTLFPFCRFPAGKREKGRFPFSWSHFSSFLVFQFRFLTSLFSFSQPECELENGKTSSSFAVLANRIDFYFQAGKLTGIQFRLVYCCRFPVHKRARIRLLWFLPLSSVLHWFCQFIFNWFSSSVNSYLPFKMRWGKLEKEKLINLVRPNQILWKKSSSEFLQAAKKADSFKAFSFKLSTTRVYSPRRFLSRYSCLWYSFFVLLEVAMRCAIIRFRSRMRCSRICKSLLSWSLLSMTN